MLNMRIGTESAFGGAYRFGGQDQTQLSQMYEGLLRIIRVQGPFDGVVGFSEGAGVALSLLVDDERQAHNNFKCGIFFSAATPEDPDVISTGVHRKLDVSTDGTVVNVPTAHIWSPDGDVHPSMGQEAVYLCDEKVREEFMHNLGHTVPGFTSNEAFSGALRAIERTIERSRS